EVDVSVDRAGGGDLAFAGDHLRPWPDDDVDVRLYVAVPRLADGRDATRLQPNVCFDDPPVIHDECVRDDGVDGFGAGTLTLAHTVSDHLAASELHLFAVDGLVLFDRDPELAVSEANAIAHRRPVHLGIWSSTVGHHGPLPSLSSAPIIMELSPYTLRSPAYRIRTTSRSCPGSTRTAVPAAMFRRMPLLACRSN